MFESLLHYQIVLYCLAFLHFNFLKVKQFGNFMSDVLFSINILSF